MPLEIQSLIVREACVGQRTCLSAGRLEVSADELCDAVAKADQRITNLQIELARPGDATRIVCVKDVIEPRWRALGEHSHEGAVRVLRNSAVVTCGPIVGYQEGIIDMSGTGAEYTPFSKKHLISLQVHVAEGIGPYEHEETLRLAGLKAAEYLAYATRDAQPDETEAVCWNESAVESSLPRIAYVYLVLSQGLLHDTYVLGRNAKQGLPLIIDPRTGMTGGIVSGNCVSACDKNTTYCHQNNPVIAELLHGHGSRWNFVGVVVSNEPTRLAQKQQSARAAVALVQQLNAEGAVVTKEGFGNPDADQMMILRGLEQAGIRTTTITDEFAGADGGSQSLADTTPEADAVVSAGNANQRIVLPAMSCVIGELPDVARLAGGYPCNLRDDNTIEVELQAIIGATNQLGDGHLRCRES